MTSKSKAPPAWAGLFNDTLEAFGEDSRACKTDWARQCEPLREKLKHLLIEEAFRAEGWLGAEVRNRLVVSSQSLQAAPFCARAFLMPPDDWFLRKDKPWHQPPEAGQGGPFSIQATLYAATPAGTPGYFLRPNVLLELHASHQMCEPFRWLLREWRRPFAHLLGWCKEDPHVNNASCSRLKGFRGNDALKKISLYLEDPGDDPAFALQFTFSDKNKPDEITRALVSYLAIWDALYSLTIPRCDPDRLHKHYLALRDHLPNVPFRESFYDPGIELPVTPEGK